MKVGRVIRWPPGDLFCRCFLMGCRKENWSTLVISVHEGVAKESWHVVLYLPKLRSQAQGRYSKGTTDEYFCWLAVLESTRGPGITQITHSCVHAPANSTVCPTRGIHFSFCYQWLCFISLIKDFYPMKSGFFTPVVWMRDEVTEWKCNSTCDV